MKLMLLLVSLALLFACKEGSVESNDVGTDTGPVTDVSSDNGETDGGQSDSGGTDSGESDSGEADTTPTVSLPRFTPEPGGFSQDITVTIGCDTEGAEIFYTTEGSDPSESSDRYTGPIPVAGDNTIKTIKAIAIKPGYINSEIATGIFAIDYTQVASPYYSVQPGAQNVRNISVEILSTTSGADIYYTTNGGDPSRSSDLYSSPILRDLLAAGPLRLKAFAVKTGFEDSGTTEGLFWVQPGAFWENATENAPFSPMYGHTSVVFNGKMWVIGGSNSVNFYNGVWSSTNGVNWTFEATGGWFAPRYGHTSVVYNGSEFCGGDDAILVIGGNSSTFQSGVWFSCDGETWIERRPVFDRVNHTSVVYENMLWAIGGTDISGSPLSSSEYSFNGLSWYPAFSGDFMPRWGHTSVVFDNKMWVIAGTNGTQYFNDVWYWSNGHAWAQATISAQFPPRESHTSVVYDNKMWVIGGIKGSSHLNDVWWSNNGINWHQATNGASFSRRYDHTSVTFQDKIWVIGGGNGSFLNDVWWSR